MDILNILISVDCIHKSPLRNLKKVVVINGRYTYRLQCALMYIYNVILDACIGLMNRMHIWSWRSMNIFCERFPPISRRHSSTACLYLHTLDTVKQMMVSRFQALCDSWCIFYIHAAQLFMIYHFSILARLFSFDLKQIADGGVPFLLFVIGKNG